MTDKTTYNLPDGTQVDLTDEEATKLGFCPGCGYIVAGNEHDDRYLSEFGLCYECVDEMRIELGEYDEPDDYFIEY